MSKARSSSDAGWIARLTRPGQGGAVVLGKDLQFRVEGDDPTGALALLANLAGLHAGTHPASPADGSPGRALAQRVAKALGAEVELAPPPPFDPEVVY